MWEAFGRLDAEDPQEDTEAMALLAIGEVHG
jgi:hypothetical protein